MIMNHCIKKIGDLLKRNELKKVFKVLENIFENNDELDELYREYILHSAYYDRTKRNRLGLLISWEEYNVSTSQVIDRVFKLATILCEYADLKSIRQKEKRSVAKWFQRLSVRLGIATFRNKYKLLKRLESIENNNLNDQIDKNLHANASDSPKTNWNEILDKPEFLAFKDHLVYIWARSSNLQ